MKTLRGGALLVTLRRSHTIGMQSKVHPTYKTKYRVANWPAYNQALVRRGDVTVWFSSEAIAAWTPRRSGRRGGQRRYSDLAIEAALTLRLLYHLPLRQAEGFLHALFGMMRLDLSAPDYTTLSRRQWKKASGYHRQGRVENTFFRYKSIIGDGLRARSPAGQGSEVVLGCEILNRLTELGRPVSYRIGQ